MVKENVQAVTSSSRLGGTLASPRRAGRVVAGSAVARHLAVLVGYLAAGILVTWPRATYLTDGKLPATRDTGSYVWDFWWMARQVEHFSNPWFTRAITAPVGAQLGYHALMPFPGVVMMPVTLAFGPTASYNLLSIVLPGLLCYAMYRVGRLMFRSQVAAIAAGGFFGLSTLLTWHTWYQLNLAVGVLFLPLALEAAIRLRRHPTGPQAVILGVILGASLLTDQESALLVGILVIVTLAPWLAGHLLRRGFTAGRRAPAAPRTPAAPWSSAGPGGAVGPVAAQASTGAETAHASPATSPPAPEAPAPGGSTHEEAAPGALAPGASASGTPAAGTPAAGTRAGRAPTWRRALAVTLTAAAVAVAVASPQIVAMVAQTRSGGASFPARAVDQAYVMYSSHLPWLFGASPRVMQLSLTALKPISYPPVIAGRPSFRDGVVTFGLVLTVMALFGLIVSWRRRSAWLLALLWAGCAALALGPVLKIGSHVYVPAPENWHGVRLSGLMPYTWFVRIRALAGFREAARIAMLAIVPAALLAGAAVEWLRYHAAVLLIPVLALGLLEAGWGGTHSVGTMPTALPKVDGPIAADHSASLVVDVPFGVRGGIPLPGEGGAFNPEAQVLATADGHPRAIAYLSRIPAPTLAAIRRHPFYDGLLNAEGQQSRHGSERRAHVTSYPALIAAARMDARRMDIGWVLVWQRSADVSRYLASTGFRFAYTADGVSVYRPAAG